LFTLLPLVACWRYEPREHPRPLALARPAIPPSPLRDRVGYSDHVRFRGYLPVHWCSGLQPPCLRFAAAVTGRHARLGSRLLARLCRGRHRRRQDFNALARRNPHRSRRALLTHRAPPSGQTLCDERFSHVRRPTRSHYSDRRGISAQCPNHGRLTAVPLG